MNFKITENIDTNNMTKHQYKLALKTAGLNLPAFDPATVTTVDFTVPTPADIVAAATDAATKGKNPAEDKKVQALLLAALLADKTGGFAYRNQVAISKAELQHYQDNAPAQLEELEAQFNDAVATMTHAAKTIPGMDLHDGLRQAGNMPHPKAQAVTEAFHANNKAASLLEALPTIAAAAHGRALAPHAKWSQLIYVKASLHDFNTYKLHGESTSNTHARKHNVWDNINDGLTIELATEPAEVRDRIQRIEDELDGIGRDYQAEANQQDIARHQAKAMGYN